MARALRGLKAECEFSLRRLDYSDGCHSYLVIKSLSVIGRCSMNMNIPASKLGGLRTQNCDILDKDAYLLSFCVLLL
jgi:hypothetical protein